MTVILVVLSKKFIERNTLIFTEKAKNVQAWTFRHREDFFDAGTNWLNLIKLRRDNFPPTQWY